MFNKLEFELRRVGADAVADGVKSLHTLYGKDIPLPTSESDARRLLSDELKEALKREGITAVYSLTGETIADQKENGKKFWRITESGDNSVLAVRSLIGDVAIDPRPNTFFLPKSNNLTLNQQLELTAEYSYKLQRKLQTDAVEAILGQAPDYTALAFAHLDATDERLFGKNYGFRYTRTQTPVGRSGVAVVGVFSADGGLDVNDWRRGDGSDSIWAVPLVVPKLVVGH